MSSIYLKDPQVSQMFIYNRSFERSRLRCFVLFESILDESFQVCLTDAFRQRNLGDFIYALEFLNADINQQEGSALTVFQNVLKTPQSADYIKSCISNGAECYKV